MPRDVATARALMTLSRSRSTTPSSAPSAAAASSGPRPGASSVPSRSVIDEMARAPRSASSARATAADRRTRSIAGCSACQSPLDSATFSDREYSSLSRASRTAAQASTATLRCAWSVLAPRCGVSSRCGVVRKGWSSGSGSFVYASTTAPRRWPDRSASASAGLVDDAAAREVGDHGTRAQPRQLPGADHSAGLVGERCVHREHVAGVEQGVERGAARHVQPVEALLRDVRIVADHRHAERAGADRDLATDASHADDAERAPLDLGAEQFGALPASLVHGLIGARHVAQQADQHGEEQLGHRYRVARRRVDDRDAEGGGGVHGYVVHAHAGAADHAEPLAGAEQRFGDARRAAPDDGVVVADAREQFRFRARRLDVHVKRRHRPEQGDAFRVDFVGDEDAEGHSGTACGTTLLRNWGGRTRTSNFLINSQAVCQLTYAPSNLRIVRRNKKRPPMDLAGAGVSSEPRAR